MCQPCELLYTCYLLTCYLLLLLLLLLLPFNGLFSRTVCVSRYQKGKTGVDLNEARDDGVSFRMAVASAGLYANNLHLAPDRKHLITQFFTGRMRDLTTGTRCTCPRRDGQAWLAGTPRQHTCRPVHVAHIVDFILPLQPLAARM